MREVIFYRSGAGSAKEAQRVTWVLRLIEELDRFPTTYFKKLKSTDDIWEARVESGGNIYRLLGFLDRGNLVILNHAFQKKSQKTPKREISIAERRKRDYQAGRKNL